MKEIVESEKRLAVASTTKELTTVASDNFNVHHYRCEWQINPYLNYIAGKITPAFTMTATGNSIILDLTTQLMVDSVVYHNNKISFQQQTGDALNINFPAQIMQGTKDSVSIYYRGAPAPPNIRTFVQYYHAGVPVVWTLSEPYGAKDWW
ncbi:MAG TPA: hypothetical protein VHL77_09930, partial [Ferruginibacter sp.]|nr:hypothetical protein [Ferruginibacter sp.]